MWSIAPYSPDILVLSQNLLDLDDIDNIKSVEMFNTGGRIYQK